MDGQGRERLIAQYAEGSARLAAAVATVPVEALKWRPAPAAWSAHEVVCHCAETLVADPAPPVAVRRPEGGMR